ncbi:MAG: hypothetical protein WD887_02950 [Candidatus Saccharimonadales bacterium]
MANPERPDGERHKLLDRYGITPSVARNWFQETFNITPEMVIEHGGFSSHRTVALAQIALREEGSYLLEEVYLQIREEFEQKQKAEREAAGFEDANLLTETSFGRHRIYELRDFSDDLKKWQESPELQPPIT